METKKKLALVLAGGGSLGAYQVGAMEALTELGYQFDIVTGTSIGAINGAFVCNKQLDRLKDLWLSITPEQVMVNGINLSIRELGARPTKTFAIDLRKWGLEYLRGGRLGADISPFKEYVRRSLDIDACYASDVKYGLVTTLFPSMKLVDVDMQAVDRENFLDYIHASSACFPIFPVEKIGKHRYIDGFYNDNLPIRLAFSMGADNVIAIDMRLFSLKPQHSFYLSLPNVTYIAPYITMGSMMDFSIKVIQKNMALGYLDVMKHYKKLRGYLYAFEGIDNVTDYLSYILREFDTDSKYIISEIIKGIRTPMDETDYFIRTIEIIALKLGIREFFRKFTFEEFKQLLAKKVKELYAKKVRDKLSAREKRNQISTSSGNRSSRTFALYLASFAKKYLDLDIVNLKLDVIPGTQNE